MNKAEKSLRWVVNQIPDFKPTANEEKMLLAIKLYSEAGAEEIKRLEAENAALRERLSRAVEFPCKVGDKVYGVGFTDCEDGHTTNEKKKRLEKYFCLIPLYQNVLPFIFSSHLFWPKFRTPDHGLQIGRRGKEGSVSTAHPATRT